MSLPDLRPLGPRVELFTPARTNICVGFVLGALIAAGGLTLAALSLTQAREDAVGSLSGLFLGGTLFEAGRAGRAVARALAAQ